MRFTCLRIGGTLVLCMSCVISIDLFAQDNTKPMQVQEVTTQQPAPTEDIKSDVNEIAAAIEKYCHYDPKETNPKKIRKTNDCMSKAIRIHRQRIHLNDALLATAQAEVLMRRQRAAARVTPKVREAQPQQPTSGGPPQAFVGSSLTGTPTTCGTIGGGINNPALLRVHRVVMTPQVASDDFGHRLGYRYIVYQVTVENGSKDFQFMLQDVSIDFSRQFHQDPGTYSYSASGQDLSLLRGVPEKGEDLDPRNAILHVLQGIGSVAAGVSGLTSFADVMGPAVANFNGPFIQGYTAIAPDHTGTQLNRLSDSAFVVNTVIDKQRGKTIAMFIPADEILSQDEQKEFRKDPNAFLGFGDQPGILNAADVCVDGTFIQAVTAAAPTLSTAVLAKTPTPAANLDTVLTLTGSNLIAGDTEVVLNGATPTNAAIVTTDGKTGTAQVHLPSDYTKGTTTATLRSKTTPSLTSGAGVTITIAP